MKKIFILLVLTFAFKNQIQAQITWSGLGTDDNFSTTANWVGGVVPGSGDDVVFDGTGTKNCTFDFDIQVNSFAINSGYTGTIDAGATVPTIIVDFSVSAGTFISTTDLSNGGLIIGGSFNLNGGTFNPNGGVVTIVVNDAQTTNILGSPTFDQLDIVSTTLGNNLRNVNFGSVTTSTLNLLGGSKSYAYQGNVSITDELGIFGSNTGTPTGNTATFNFTGAGPINIIGASAFARNKLSSMVFNTSGNITMSGHINIQDNWTGTQGALTAGTSTVNMYGSSAAISGTAAAFDNLILQTGSSVTFPSSAEVLVSRTFSNSGTANFPTTFTLGLNGGSSVTQNLSGIGTISGIHAHSNTRTINLNSTTSILDFLDVDAGVTFATGGNLTLTSTNALTARVGSVGAGASITGNVTVETVIPGGGTGWATLGVRGVQGQTLLSWDTYTGTGSPSGIPMTCDNCAFTPSSVPTGWFRSIYGWDESTSFGYDSTVNTGTSLTPGKGFWVYVGDGFSSTSDLKVINTGALFTGQLNIPVTSGAQSGFNLVANPYASPISWDLVMQDFGNLSDINDAIYAFNANSGIYTSYVNGAASSPAPNGIDDVIAGGQGFYVETGFGGNLNFDESMKVSSNTSANPIIRETAKNVGKIFRLHLAGAYDQDWATFRIHSDATNVFDKKWDAKKLFVSPGYSGYPGAYDHYTTISSKDATDVDYSVNSLPSLVNSTSIPLLVKVSTSGSYTINAQDFKDFAMCVGLVDKLDNSYHDLRLSPYVFTISDTTSTPRFELFLCKDESLNLTGVSEVKENTSTILISQNEQGAVVKTIFDKNTEATISAYNIVGQKLMDDVRVTGTATKTQLPIDLHNQVVIIKVTTDNEIVTKKIVLH